MKTTLTMAAVIVLTAMTTTAFAQPKNHNSSGMREACASDIATHCAGVEQGQATMQCVMKNRDKMSDGCKSAMAAMRQGGGMSGGGMGGGSDGGKPAAAKPEEKKPM